MRAGCLLLLIAGSLSAADGLVDQGNRDFYNLDYDEALAAYQKASVANPLDAGLHNHVAQASYREMYRNGALESELVSGDHSFIRRARLEPSPEVERRFFAEVDKAMELSQSAIARNARDTTALHLLSVSYALRANYGFLVRKSWRASLSDSTIAHKYDTQVVKSTHPTTMPACCLAHTTTLLAASRGPCARWD